MNMLKLLQFTVVNTVDFGRYSLISPKNSFLLLYFKSQIKVLYLCLRHRSKL